MKIIVIGCGSIGQRHIKNLISIKAGRIMAFDVDRKRLEEVKRISRKVLVSSSLDLLWKERPDAAFIASPTALHPKHALEAAGNGCHMFIEKPLSHNMRGIDSLIKIAKQKRLITFIGYAYRFNDCMVKISRLIDKNLIGKVASGRFYFGSYLPDRHPGEDYRIGYGAKRSLGGGVILDAISHQLDMAISLFGRPERISSYYSKSSGLDIDVEDTADVLLKFPKGEIVALHSDFIERPYRCSLELVGTKGKILCDLVSSTLKRYSTDTKKWIIDYGNRDHNEAYIKQARYFIKCIRKGCKPPVDVIRGKEEMEILLKIKKEGGGKR